MTNKEYDDKMKDLNKEFEKKKTEIMIDYAEKNNPYKIGDILTDHAKTIKVDSVKIEKPYFGSYPQCVYFGFVLKKDGTLRKDKKRDCIYQGNINEK